MNLPLLALFTRSLREDAHGAATYWARAALATFILLVLAGLAATKSWVGAPGKNFFIGIVSLQAISITLVGLSYFGSAITEEKEEQTLGLLRMTDLNPLSILLGKSTSRLGGALLLLAAQFPFTVFAVTLGGVSLGQIIATYCTLGAYTFLLCNVALLGSVIARRTAGAAAFAAVILALFLSAGPLLADLNQSLADYGIKVGLKPIADKLWHATPLARLIEILGTGFSGSPAGWQVISNLALGVVFFLLAWAAFGRFCDRAPDGVATGDTPRWLSGQRRRRPPRPWMRGTWALVWKDYYFLFGGHAGLIVRTLAYGGGLLVAVWQTFAGGRPGTIGLGAGFISIATFAFSIDVAVMAARLFRAELNDQTLSTLAGLPCTMRQIAYCKGRAFLFAATPGLIASFTVGPLLLYSLSGSAGGTTIGLMMFTHTISSWLSLILLVHIVAWLSLSMKRGAMPIGYVANYTLNTLIMFVAFALTSAFNLGFRGIGNFSFIVLGPMLSCTVSIIAIVILHRRSLRRLEALVGES